MNRVARLTLCALALVAYPAAAQPVNIGVIDIVRIERESKRAQQPIEGLKQEFAARAQALSAFRDKVAAMRSELETLNPDTAAAEMEKRRREFEALAQRFEQDRRLLEEDLEGRKAQERQKLYRDVNAVVQKVAEAQKIDLVLQQAVYTGRAIDITDEVLKALDASAAGK